METKYLRSIEDEIDEWYSYHFDRSDLKMTQHDDLKASDEPNIKQVNLEPDSASANLMDLAGVKVEDTNENKETKEDILHDLTMNISVLTEILSKIAMGGIDLSQKVDELNSRLETIEQRMGIVR